MLRTSLILSLAALLVTIPAAHAAPTCVLSGTACVDESGGTYLVVTAFGGFFTADAGAHTGSFTGVAVHTTGAGTPVNVEAGSAGGNLYVLAQVKGYPGGTGDYVSVYRNLNNGYTCQAVAGQFSGCQYLP